MCIRELAEGETPMEREDTLAATIASRMHPSTRSCCGASNERDDESIHRPLDMLSVTPVTSVPWMSMVSRTAPSSASAARVRLSEADTERERLSSESCERRPWGETGRRRSNADQASRPLAVESGRRDIETTPPPSEERGKDHEVGVWRTDVRREGMLSEPVSFVRSANKWSIPSGPSAPMRSSRT